jgi:RimJ/RimL family protein N-acetyltransferase
VNIRAAAEADDDDIWRILEPTFRVGETYPIPRDISRVDALAYWHAPGHGVFVAEDASTVLGTYYLRANNRGGGAHVANCGYVVATSAFGRGVARAMCTHSLNQERAVRLWQGLGFIIVGRLPGAFQHPRLGIVDAYVMMRNL